MSLIKRSDGRYVVKYKDQVTGKWRQRAFRDKTSALQMEAELDYDRRKHERLTVGDAVTAYLLNVPHVPGAVRNYSFLVNGTDCVKGGHNEGPAEFLADKYCSELTRRDLENYRLRLRERGQCNVTINMNVNRLKAAMNWCVDQELLESNPWAKYRSLPYGVRGSRSGTLEDFLRVYAELPEWMRWACRTCMALCLRPGMTELFSLEWKAFNWMGRCVKIYMSKVRRTKTVYPPDDYMAEARERYSADVAAGKSVVCRNEADMAFTCRSTYQTHWTRACRRAGVRMPFYAIRHIAASEMLANGADLAAVAAQLGHSNPATTAAFYAHAVADAQKRAAMALPSGHLVRNGAGTSDKKATKTRT